MRLKRFRLNNYGCFGGLDLQLAIEPGRITLITAPNGAGKSVLRQAFHDLLFDIPLQSPMKFRHGYLGMSLHADAVTADGAAFSFGWERGAKPQRVTSDPARFNALRGAVTPQQLESLFALDTARLRKGGTDLKGGATLSEALLAGTGELASAKAVRAIIEGRRNDNWGKGKSKPPLNAAANRLEETRKGLRGTIVRPEARAREEHALAELECALEQARADRTDASAATERLNRIGHTRPPLQVLEEAKTWLVAHPDAPALPPGQDTILAAARAALALAQAGHEAAADALGRAAEAAARVKRDPACTSVADRLAVLPGLLGEAVKAAKDIVGLRSEHASKLAGIEASLQAIGLDLPVHRAAEIIPAVGLRAEVQAAITQEAERRTKLDLARSEVERARNALAKAETAIAVAEPLPDGLLALLAEIRADRNPLTHAEELEHASVTAAAELRRRLALLPGWTGTAEALRAVTLPPDAAFERLDAARTAADVELDGARRHHADLAAQDSSARRELAGLREDALPDTASMLAARAERDRGMRLILARAFGIAPSAAEEADFAGVEPISLAYERRVRDADALADRRTAELTRVQEAERFGRALKNLAEPLRLAEAREAAAAERLAAAKEVWAEAVALLALGPHTTIGELRQVGSGRVALVEALTRLELAAEAQSGLVRRHLGWAERLATCLGVEAGSLGALLAVADQCVGKARAAEKAISKQQADLDGARRAVPEATERFETATAAMERWQDNWADLIARLRQPPGESPAAVTAALAEIAALETDHREAGTIDQRIRGIEADRSHFEAIVTSLAQEIGQDMGADAIETARTLITQGDTASRAEAAWEQAQKGEQMAANTEEKARGGLHGAQSGLDAVIAACGALDADSAEARIRFSCDYTDQVARRDAARAQLIAYGDGLDVTALRAEADAVPIDEMVQRRQAAKEADASAGERAEKALLALNAARSVLDFAAGSTDAMEARAGHEAAIAVFDRLLEDQLVLHLASTMLGDAMRQVEEGIGGSALLRVSAAFASVTDAAYALESHDGPAGEELYAVERSFPNERKALAELSEGTRDQLYLALRIEALRGHTELAMAVPFIADDIMQTFDDGRVAAALRALRDLSENLQVIVLTHHAHLQSVAEKLPLGSVQIIHIDSR